MADGREDAATRDIGLSVSCGDMSGKLATESSLPGVCGSEPLAAVRSGSGVAAGDAAGAGLAAADVGAAGVAAAGGEGSVKEQMVVRVASMTSSMPRMPAAVARTWSARNACTTSTSAVTACTTADSTCRHDGVSKARPLPPLRHAGGLITGMYRIG